MKKYPTNEFKIKVKSVKNGDIFVEPYSLISSDMDNNAAIIYFKSMIYRFNNTLREFESPRKLLSIYRQFKVVYTNGNIAYKFTQIWKH